MTEEITLREDPLSRIQREIIEVTEREREFREGHFRINRLMSESTIQVNGTNGHVNGDAEVKPATLNRAVSTPGITNNNDYRRFMPQNGHKYIMHRFIANKGNIPMRPSPVIVATQTAPVPATKGIMQRFIASKGNLPSTSSSIAAKPSAFQDQIPMLAPTVVTRLPEGKPVRKGYVSVEEKILKELQDMKDREAELKRLRRQQRPSDLALSDNETSSESDEEEIPSPSKLKPTKSLGELFEALSEGTRSPSPRNNSGHESFGSLKPAKSLAELCNVAPGEEFHAPTSTELIAKWEARKK